METPLFRSTTVIAVVKDGTAAMAADGQVTMGEATIVKHGARKLRRLYDGKVLGGFAGSVADALLLFDAFERQLSEQHGQLRQAAASLVRAWRQDRMLRRLEALLLVCDRENVLLLAGSGEVIEPDDGIAAIGSGGNFALAAARALTRETTLPAGEVAQRSLQIASEICVYTNDRIHVEELGGESR